MIDWTNETILKAVGWLRFYGNTIDAAREMKTTPDAMRKAFEAHGMSSPGVYCKQGRGQAMPEHEAHPTHPAPPPEPSTPVNDLDAAITARREARDESATKRQLKQALERIEDQQRAIDALSAPMPAPVFSIVKHLGSDKRQGWGLSCLSDVHAGALVEPTVSVCFNEYNPDICRESLDRYFEYLAWRYTKDEPAYDIHGVCIWLGGDIIDGHLHDDQTETSEAPLVTLNWLEPFLMGRIESLASELGDAELRILCSYGNHSRDTAKPRNETAWRHSHEWAMYQRLGRHFANHKTVRVHTDKARDQYTDLFNFRIHGTHGDTTSQYQGGVGGITIPLRKSYATWQVIEPSYLHLTGHWHTQLDVGDGLANGSVIGYNAFARSKSFRPEPPQQICCIIDKERGKNKVSSVWVRPLTGRQHEALTREARAWEARAK